MEIINGIEKIISLGLEVKVTNGIEKTKKVGNYKDTENREKFGIYDGYRVDTNDDSYYILIDNSQHCCEDWGYMQSEDDISQFIGSEILEVRLTNSALKTIELKLKSENLQNIRDKSIQFVDFITTNGVLQFVVYNEQNGYYSHEIIIAKGEEVIKFDIL